MSLRFRLTILYVTFLVVVLIAFSLGAYFIASKRIYGGVDDSLSVLAEVADSLLGDLSSSLSRQDIIRNRSILDVQTSIGTDLQIRSLDGRILYSSLRPSGQELPLPHGTRLEDPTFFTVKIQGLRFRMLYKPVVRDDELFGSIEVAKSLKQTDEALAEIRNIFIFGSVAVIVIATVPSYILAGRALKPVRQVAQLARGIERTGDFSRRLPAPTGGGEVAELVTTFNAMIERVERTFEAQRAFLSNSSHELRRPLTVLRTNIDILSEAELPADERVECLKEMRQEAEAMSRLIANLLLLSREESESLSKDTVDLSRLCEQLMVRLRSWSSGIELVAEIEQGIHVLGDRERLAQMVWNLLENALWYTPDGGKVGLRLTRSPDVIRIEVHDSGLGIPADEMPHVFERFYRGRVARSQRPEGAGLGLAIVKYIAEGHGGVATASSIPGVGSSFVVDLPPGHTPSSS